MRSACPAELSDSSRAYLREFRNHSRRAAGGVSRHASCAEASHDSLCVSAEAIGWQPTSSVLPAPTAP